MSTSDFVGVIAAFAALVFFTVLMVTIFVASALKQKDTHKSTGGQNYVE